MLLCGLRRSYLRHPSHLCFLLPLRTRCPDGSEEDADDRDVVIGHENERPNLKLSGTQNQHNLDDFQNDREDEIRDRDPEERLQTFEQV